MLETNGSFVAEFKSMSAAARAIRISLTSVWMGCNNPGKICSGYKWKYLDNNAAEDTCNDCN